MINENSNQLRLSILPESLSRIVESVSESIDCDPSMVLMPLLAGCSGAIGNSVVIQIAGDWTEPAILWCGVVAESGNKKTPAAKKILSPIRRLQQQLIRDWELEIDGLMENASKPTRPRILVGDSTVEAMAPLFKENPRGLLLLRDELAGFINSMDAYKSGKGGDASHWLSMFNAEPIHVDRKKDRESICVPAASLSIFGGIQPEILKRSFAGENQENGMMARFLFAYPENRKQRFHEGSVPDSITTEIELLMNRLFEISMCVDSIGVPVPSVVAFDGEAKELFKKWCNRLGEETFSYSGPSAAFINKLPATVARLALVFHLSKWAVGSLGVFEQLVDKQTVDGAIILGGWFREQIEQIHEDMHVTSEENAENKILKTIARADLITERQIKRSVGLPYKEVRRVINYLLEQRLIKSISRTGFGRPTTDYCLAELRM